MSRRNWVHNSCLILGLIFIVLGERLFFSHDISGLLVHFALGIALFIVALFTGQDRKGSDGKVRHD